MKREYRVDKRRFKKQFIAISAPGTLIGCFIFNLAVITNGKWNLIVGLVLVILFLLLLCVVYQVAWKSWKTAYVTISDHEVCYYRIIKDGINEGIREFEEQMAIIHRIYNVAVGRFSIRISGDIDLRVCQDPKRGKSVTRKVSSTRIPLCFENPNEIIYLLKRTVD